MSKGHIWRGIVRMVDHPDNGRGSMSNVVFVYLDCGHSRSYPKSKQPSGLCKVRCEECERKWTKR